MPICKTTLLPDIAIGDAQLVSELKYYKMPTLPLPCPNSAHMWSNCSLFAGIDQSMGATSTVPAPSYGTNASQRKCTFEPGALCLVLPDGLEGPVRKQEHAGYEDDHRQGRICYEDGLQGDAVKVVDDRPKDAEDHRGGVEACKRAEGGNHENGLLDSGFSLRG
jgi:hypothetical protein